MVIIVPPAVTSVEPATAGYVPPAFPGIGEFFQLGDLPPETDSAHPIILSDNSIEELPTSVEAPASVNAAAAREERATRRSRTSPVLKRKDSPRKTPSAPKRKRVPKETTSAPKKRKLPTQQSGSHAAGEFPSFVEFASCATGAPISDSMLCSDTMEEPGTSAFNSIPLVDSALRAVGQTGELCVSPSKIRPSISARLNAAVARYSTLRLPIEPKRTVRRRPRRITRSPSDATLLSGSTPHAAAGGEITFTAVPGGLRGPKNSESVAEVKELCRQAADLLDSFPSDDSLALLDLGPLQSLTKLLLEQTACGISPLEEQVAVAKRWLHYFSPLLAVYRTSLWDGSVGIAESQEVQYREYTAIFISLCKIACLAAHAPSEPWDCEVLEPWTFLELG